MASMLIKPFVLWRFGFRSRRGLLKIPCIKSFRVVGLQRTVKKCTTIYNAQAQPLPFLLNLLFSDVPVAVAY